MDPWKFRRAMPWAPLPLGQLGAELAEWIARSSGVQRGQVLLVLDEVQSGVLFFTRQGYHVRLPGIGRFSPSVGRDGEVRVNYVADRALAGRLNLSGAYPGEVTNRGRVGLDNAGYKALWDSEHPDDPLEL